MVNLLFPLLLIRATSSINAASLPNPSFGPPIPIDLTDLFSSATNTTPLDTHHNLGAIDPDVTFFIQYSTIPLRPIAFLINAVNAMALLGMKDFQSTIGPVTASLPEYFDVVIKGIPTQMPGVYSVIRMRYVLWGIMVAAREAMQQDHYVTMRVALRYYGVEVGYVLFEGQNPPPQSLSLVGSDDGSSSSAENLEKRSDGALPATLSPKSLADLNLITNSTSLPKTNITSPSNADHVEYFFKSTGQPLSNQEFFTPIFICLEYIAHYAFTLPVKGFTLSRQRASWIEFRDFSGRPRTAAPFFEYQLIAKALRIMPIDLARFGWSEMLIVIQVDGVRVGDGWLRKGAS